MPGIARFNDMVLGTSWHIPPSFPGGSPIVTGNILQTSLNTFAEAQGTARMGDMVQISCVHCGCIGYIIQGTPLVLTNALPTARLGDLVQWVCGVGNIISSAIKTNAN